MNLKKFAANFTIVVLIFLIFTDFIYPPRGVESVNRIIPQVGRASLLLFMSIMLLLWSFKQNVIYLNPISKSVIWLGSLIFIHFFVMLYVTFPFINILIKTFYWIIGYFFIFYLSSKGYINDRHILFFTFFGVIIFFAIVLRDYFNLNLQWGKRFYSVSKQSN